MPTPEQGKQLDVPLVDCGRQPGQFAAKRSRSFEVALEQPFTRGRPTRARPRPQRTPQCGQPPPPTVDAGRQWAG